MSKTEFIEYAIYTGVALGYAFLILSIRNQKWAKWAFHVSTFSIWLIAGSLLYTDLNREFAGIFLANLAFQLLLRRRG